MGGRSWRRDTRCREGTVFGRLRFQVLREWRLCPSLPITRLALAISPGVHRLVYTREMTNSNIWAVEVAAPAKFSNKFTPTPKSLIGSSRKEFAPDFSPDGRQIVFESSRSGWSELWVADRDGSHPRQLTELTGSVASFPRWSPDGTRVVFHSRQKIHASLYVVDVVDIQTGRSRELRYDAVDDFMPSWSHDGKWIYFASQRTQYSRIWKVAAEGGRAIQLTRNGGYAPLESTEGKFIFYTKPDNGIWRKPVFGGEEQQIVADLVAGANSAYAPLPKGIYFIRQASQAGAQALVFSAFQTVRLRKSWKSPAHCILGWRSHLKIKRSYSRR